MIKQLILTLALLGCSTLVLADKDNEQRYNQVSLSAEASESIANDILVTHLFAQQEGNDAAVLAAEINKTILWAITEAKQYADIEVKTESYSTQPVYQKNRVSAWRVKQSIQLKSKNIPLLSQLIGDLQARMSVQSIDYQVSDHLRRKVEDRLITQAIKSFEQRAKLISNTMQHKNYQLVDMQIRTSNNPAPRPNFRMSAMSSGMSTKSAPAIEAGTKKLSVNIQGKIQLGRD